MIKGSVVKKGYDIQGRLELTISVSEGKNEALALGDKEYQITFNDRKKRSLDANAYFHLLVNKIAGVNKSSDSEVKKWLNLEYGTIWKEGETIVGYKLLASINPDNIYPYCKFIGDTEENGKKFKKWVLYKQTHTLDTKEMAKLIDGTIYEAKELGIETMTPAELERLKGYGSKRNV